MAGVSLSTVDELLRDVYVPPVLEALGETPWSALLLRVPNRGWTSRFTFDRLLAFDVIVPAPAGEPVFIRAGVIDLFPRARRARSRAEYVVADVRTRVRGAVAALRGAEVEGVWA